MVEGMNEGSVHVSSFFLLDTEELEIFPNYVSIDCETRICKTVSPPKSGVINCIILVFF